MLVVTTYNRVVICKNQCRIFKAYAVLLFVNGGFFVIPNDKLTVDNNFNVAHAKASPPPT